MKPRLDICHLAIIHDVFCDSRIMDKMATSSVARGDRVTIITGNTTNKKVDEVQIISVSEEPLKRTSVPTILFTVYRKALAVEADVYHVHEVPLMIVGLALRLINNKTVIVDFHEDFEAEIMDKYYLPLAGRIFFRWLFVVFKNLFVGFFNGIILAEDSYGSKFRRFHKRITVRNYPISVGIRYKTREECGDGSIVKICYAGSISEDRGAMDLIEAARILKEDKSRSFLVLFIGLIDLEAFQRKMEARIASENLEGIVTFVGRKPHQYVRENLCGFHIGFSALHDQENYRGSLPTKILEYNLAGLPCVVSDLPTSWDYVVPNETGIIVPPQNPTAIAKGIQRLVKNWDEYLDLREKCRRHVLGKYEWRLEFEKLDSFYRRIASGSHLRK